MDEKRKRSCFLSLSPKSQYSKACPRSFSLYFTCMQPSFVMKTKPADLSQLCSFGGFRQEVGTAFRALLGGQR
ncbi:hypothetical protein V6N12_075933 [Hibiscus sabdariffa]|uniref:Uncharacterized protein n=1 Tax=Hibiscus sabdariffa TaxID=183260 RepID=A0ABR2AYE5_9ROSI